MRLVHCWDDAVLLLQQHARLLSSYIKTGIILSVSAAHVLIKARSIKHPPDI